MPGELAHAHESYAAVDAALRRWADTIDNAQAQADRGLQLAREAHADRHAAADALASAELAWTTAHAQQLTYQVLEKSPLSVPPPTSAQLRSTDRAAQHAQIAIGAARAQIADADARLAAARALVLEAKERRDDSERATVRAIAAAGDLAVQPSSVWEAIQDSSAWQTLVAVATVVLTIVSIVAIFVGGPLVWALILAATILLVVNALLSIAQGKDAWGELIWLAVGLVPGGRVLGLAVRGLAAVTHVSTAVARVADVTARLRSGVGGGLRRILVKFADETGELRLPGDERALYEISAKQSKHIPGSQNFDADRSWLTTDPGELLSKVGQGRSLNGIPLGEAGSRERIDFGSIIGRFTTGNGVFEDTTVGIVHFASGGSIHIVPGKPIE